jgi:hypothetical protein
VAIRFAIFAIVARLHPVDAWICDQEEAAFSIAAIRALRFTSSSRPTQRALTLRSLARFPPCAERLWPQLSQSGATSPRKRAVQRRGSYANLSGDFGHAQALFGHEGAGDLELSVVERSRSSTNSAASPTGD